MDKEFLIKILQLDSIIRCLDWEDRIRIHLYISGRARMTSPKILAAGEWIEKWQWIAPDMRYGQDRLVYYSSPNPSEGGEQWRPIEELEEIMKGFKL